MGEARQWCKKLSSDSDANQSLRTKALCQHQQHTLLECTEVLLTDELEKSSCSSPRELIWDHTSSHKVLNDFFPMLMMTLRVLKSSGQVFSRNVLQFEFVWHFLVIRQGSRVWGKKKDPRGKVSLSSHLP